MLRAKLLTRGRTEPGTKTNAWILRWDTVQEEKPRVLGVGDESPSAEVFETGLGDFVVFDGYLFDRADLQAQPLPSDASLVASAYKRWTDHLFEKLRGAFTVAIWDHERKCLIAGRDAMGLNPCFYWWDDRVFLMSSSLDAILAQPEVDGRFNRVVVAEYIQTTLSTHQLHETFYERVRRLPSAHALSLRRGHLAISRYWDPVPPGFAWTSQEELSQFPRALERAVSRCLTLGADSLALSGGFDSIGIAVLAAEQSQGSHPLHALSLRFTNTSCDEGDTQIAVAHSLGMPLLLRTIEESLDGHTFVDAAFALSRASNCPVLSVWQPMYSGLLRSAAQIGLKGLMMGTGGDDMLYVDVSYGADCLAAHDLRGLWRFYRACTQTSPHPAPRIARAVFWHGAIKPEIRRVAGSILSFITPTGKDWLRRQRRRKAAIRSWFSRADTRLTTTLQDRQCNPLPIALAPGERSYVRTLRYLTQAPLLQLEMEQGATFMKHVGFTLFLPYFDRDFVELLLRTRPEHLIAGGYHKAPLRRLVAQRLPTIDMPAKKVAFTHMAHAVLRSQGRTMWGDCSGPRMLAELHLVNPKLVNSFMDDYFAGRNDDSLQAWLFLSAEMWLQGRSVEPFVATTRRSS